MDNEVTIYTDGACSGNPGPGGWAAVLIDIPRSYGARGTAKPERDFIDGSLF